MFKSRDTLLSLLKTRLILGELRLTKTLQTWHWILPRPGSRAPSTSSIFTRYISTIPLMQPRNQYRYTITN